MTIQLYKDPNLKQPLIKQNVAGTPVHLLELPQNSPGQTTKTIFYLYNNSRNPLTDITVLHNNTQVDFVYPSNVVGHQKAMITAEWRCPLDFKEALKVMFKITAKEIAKPTL